MISIVTALYNKLELTQAFWESLRENPPVEAWEMIWIDDGSTDGTRDWLRTLPTDRHTVILNDTNRGFAANNNLGARAARGDILALLNNDLVLTAGWLEPMLASLRSTGRIGFVGNLQLQPVTGRLDHAGVCFDLTGLPDHHLKNRPPSSACGAGRFSEAVTAACCLIRREVFLAAGGFDERYRNGCEDVDLCLRLGRDGYRHWVDYRSVVRHHVSSSPGRKAREEANLALLLRTWGDTTSRLGRRDWPRNYLSRHLHNPARLNGAKTLDALARLLGLKHGDSTWAKRRRDQLLALADDAQRAP